MKLKSLGDLTVADQGLFGTKAVQLGLLMQAGYQVPDGIVVAAQSIELHGLAEVEGLILDSCRKIGSECLFAVRSSSQDEDSADHSFAGQFESILNVPYGPLIIEAIRKCLASRQSSHATAYRSELGIAQGPSVFGVIVQKMVPATFAGVCFTQSSVESETLVVEAVAGTGDQLVSGKITPAHFELNRATLEIQSKEDRLSSAVDTQLVEQVARVGRSVEQKWGYPLDIEWAFDGKELFLLQARPLSYFKTQKRQRLLLEQEKQKLREIAQEGGNVWTDFSIGDVLTHPSPLTVSGFREITSTGSGVEKAYRDLGLSYSAGEALAPQIYDSVFGRSYINVTEYVTRISGGLPLKPVIGPGNKIGLKLNPKKPSTVLLTPYSLAKVIKGIRSNFYPLRKKFYTEFQEKIQPRLEREAAIERSRDLSQMSDSELWETFRTYSNKNRLELNYYHMLTDIISGFTQAFVKWGLKMTYSSTPGMAEAKELELTTGLPGNFNTQTNLALCDVIDGQMTLETFIEKFGHRGNPDWEIAAPRWREDPSTLHRMMGQLKESRLRGRKEFEDQKKKRVDSEATFEADLERTAATRLLKKFFMKELKYFQIYSPLREATHSVCFLWVELARRVVVEMAKRTQGHRPGPEGLGDLLFFLDHKELESYFLQPTERKALLRIAQQRKADLRLLRSVYVPHLFSDQEINQIGLPPKQVDSLSFVQGQPIFQGVVHGLARVVKNLDEASLLQKGEILITQFTDPAWTPLFFVAGGLVLEQGSSFSHGALVAREIGLPSIVNAQDVTYSIRTGQQVTLDATQGKIFLHATQVC